MRLIFFLSLILLVGCKQLPRQKPTVHLKTHNQVVIANFNKAIDLTENIIASRFSRNEIVEYFSLNTGSTGFDYRSAIFNTKDSLNELPKGYIIYYDFILKEDTIGSFRVDLDSILNINSYWYYRLLGFRLLADNKLKIRNKDALKIASKYGIVGTDVHLVFQANREYPDTINNNQVTFYWDVEKDCDGCDAIEVDAKSGIVIRKTKIKIESDL